MAAAKAYHKAPIQLAEAVVEKVTDHSVIGEIEAVKPGFINLKINRNFWQIIFPKCRTTKIFL